MRMEYNRYIAYLRAANAVVGSNKVAISSLREENDNGDRIVTLGVEVTGTPVSDVNEVFDLVDVIKRAARIAKMFNTIGITYYYNGNEAIEGQEMETAINYYKGIITGYVSRVEENDRGYMEEKYTLELTPDELKTIIIALVTEKDRLDWDGHHRFGEVEALEARVRDVYTVAKRASDNERSWINAERDMV